MDGAPVPGNLLTRAKPNPIAASGVVEEPDQTSSSSRPSDQTIMQSDRHELRLLRAFLIEKVGGNDQVPAEIFAGGKSNTHIKTSVVRLV